MQDTHDLFATLVVSLNLGNNTRFFRTYPNTFTTDDAAQNLSSLRFSQSNRSADPNDPQRIITTTTTTTFTMTRDIAKGICQQFMDARLIENAPDPTSAIFKDRGIYSITPKGLHVLERFITKNGIAADHLVKVFTTQPICMRLLHLERKPADDDIITTRPVLEHVFRRFVGLKSPNYVVDANEVARAASHSQTRGFQDTVRPAIGFARDAGIEMQDLAEKTRTGQVILVKHVFSSAGAIDWLCDHSTCCCRDEAAELLAHFVRYGFITLHHDKNKSDLSTSAGGVSAAKASGSNTVEAEFRWGPKVTYRVTDEGRKIANWDGLQAGGRGADGKKISTDSSVEDDSSSRKVFAAGHANGSTNSLNSSNGTDRKGTGSGLSSSIGGEWSLAGGVGVGSMLDSQLLTKMSLKEIFEVDLTDSNWNKEGQHSSTTRLRAILEDIRLRALFRDYLKSNYCEENLGFWLDVQDFRRRFSTTSSAIGGGQQGANSSKDGARRPLLRAVGNLASSSNHSSPSTPGHGMASTAMESHQNDLNIAAVNIYRLYLAPQSPSELNIDHNLRADVVNFIQKCADEAGIPLSSLSTPRNIALQGVGSLSSSNPTGFTENPASNAASTETSSSPENGSQMVLPLRATQVQTLLRYYERIQDHIFRLLATDQVPKFIRTPDFLVLLRGGNPVSLGFYVG